MASRVRDLRKCAASDKAILQTPAATAAAATAAAAAAMATEGSVDPAAVAALHLK